MTRGVRRTFRFRDFTLEVSEHRLLRGAEEIFLRPKAFDTLVYLVERQGHLVEKNELLDKVWANTIVSETVLTHCITEIRQALRDETQHPRYLKTIPRVGYKFIAEVERITPETEIEKAVTTGMPSVAVVVLPFVNLSADPESEYFCDGLTEELINALTKVKQLRVVAHSSSFSFKGQNVDAREIGQKLNVGSVVEGSVRKVGNKLRISAQVINAADGYHLWSEQYDREMQDVFAMQDDISLAIVNKLKIKLLGEEKAALVKRYTTSLEAYHLYLKGRYFWNKRFAPGAMQTAIEHFNLAVGADPAYALAYVGLADCYNLLGHWQFLAPEEVFPRAMAAAEKALELDDGVAEAHAALAFTKLVYGWDWLTGERELKLAIDLNPSYGLIHLWYAHILCIMQRYDEARAEIERGWNLDPLSVSTNATVGFTLYIARDYGEAMDQLQKTLEMNPNFGLTYFFLGLVYVQQGRGEEAILALERAVETTGRMPVALADLGHAYGLFGERAKAKKVIEELEARSEKGYVSSEGLALVYLGLGEYDQVFECLSKAYERRESVLPWLNVLPHFDGLRSDPRLQKLLRLIGPPQMVHQQYKEEAIDRLETAYE